MKDIKNLVLIIRLAIKIGRSPLGRKVKRELRFIVTDYTRELY